jgi:hypothetical protein
MDFSNYYEELGKDYNDMNQKFLDEQAKEQAKQAEDLEQRNELEMGTLPFEEELIKHGTTGLVKYGAKKLGVNVSEDFAKDLVKNPARAIVKETQQQGKKAVRKIAEKAKSRLGARKARNARAVEDRFDTDPNAFELDELKSDGSARGPLSSIKSRASRAAADAEDASAEQLKGLPSLDDLLGKAKGKVKDVFTAGTKSSGGAPRAAVEDEPRVVDPFKVAEDEDLVDAVSSGKMTLKEASIRSAMRKPTTLTTDDLAESASKARVGNTARLLESRLQPGEVPSRVGGRSVRGLRAAKKELPGQFEKQQAKLSSKLGPQKEETQLGEALDKSDGISSGQAAKNSKNTLGPGGENEADLDGAGKAKLSEAGDEAGDAPSVGAEMAEAEAAGGGPEDPLADLAALGIGLASLFGTLFGGPHDPHIPIKHKLTENPSFDPGLQEEAGAG